MKRFYASLFACAVGFGLLASPSSAVDQPYGWTVSASSTDPNANVVNFQAGSLQTVYLWLACCDLPDGLQQGMSAAEFDLVPTGINIVATTTDNGFLNAGGSTNLLLAVGGCPCGPVKAADILIVAFEGSICFAPSATNGVEGTVDCEGDPSLYGIDWIGLSNGDPVCSQGLLCEKAPVSVDDASWSGIKSLYR